MTAKYAKDQPAGFTNRIERVAIIGAGGHVGKPIAEALVKTGRHTVKALTRAGSSTKLPEGVEKAVIDYSDEESIVAALKGQQFLIITQSVTAPPEHHGQLVNAAAKAGVPYVMPNCFGFDMVNEKFAHESLAGTTHLSHLAAIKKAGVSTSIPLVCGPWYEYCLVGGPVLFGFDFANKTLTFNNDGRERISCSTLPQCGRALAAFLSLQELPKDEHDKTPAVANWSDKPLYISSFLVSQRDMFESWKRVSGDTDADWKIDHQPAAKRLEDGMEMMRAGEQRGYVQAMFARAHYAGEDANFDDKLDNEVLGLSRESLDEVTKTVKDSLH